MVIFEEKKLLKKYINIFKDEKFCKDIINESIFAFSEIKSYFEKKEIQSILEIGSGTGVLLNELKTHYPQIKMTGLEPFQSGHKKFNKISDSIKNNKLNIINKGIEEFNTIEKFDLIFSINVLEHLKDYEKYIENTYKFLNKNGTNIILCPNYDFPYESHYIIPIIINKKITKFFFKNYIKKYEIKNGMKNHWEGLNFISKKKLTNFLKKNNYNYYFDLAIKERILNRILYDKALKRRQGLVGSLAIILKFLFLDKLLFDLFKIPFPYLKLIINNKS